ncbi:thiamine pyrophosphate-binding protein, partial [Thioclava sp. BHET1]
ERNFYQEVDQRSIYAGLTKFSARVDKAERLPDLLQQAMRVSTTGSPGPVHLELNGFWGGVLMEEFEPVMPPAPRYARCPPVRPLADPLDVQIAAKALNKAERPIIVAGSGIRTSRADAALLEFVRRAGIPVATSLDAKAAIPESE